MGLKTLFPHVPFLDQHPNHPPPLKIRGGVRGQKDVAVSEGSVMGEQEIIRQIMWCQYQFSCFDFCLTGLGRAELTANEDCEGHGLIVNIIWTNGRLQG